ncbi:MAG: hypothetical protein H7Y59_15170 [Anaerolineales bacterium]|nr:hypothetical protein [Anaerolineales bacterium]
MSEQTIQDAPERYKTSIMVLTLITTIVTSIVAGLQADANIRANNANRDSQYYAILASSEVHRTGLQTTYDLNTLTSQSREAQESLVMQITSLELQEDGNEQGVAISDVIASALQARADKLQAFSIFYTDARYAPATEDGLPNLEAYLVDVYDKANELTEKQNAATDAYQEWSSKADSYVGVLTVMAVAFFLFGLAQAAAGRMRLTFAVFGVVILLGASLWTILILVI